MKLHFHLVLNLLLLLFDPNCRPELDLAVSSISSTSSGRAGASVVCSRDLSGKMFFYYRQKYFSPRPGIEPGSPAWQAGILTSILSRIAWFQDSFYGTWKAFWIFVTLWHIFKIRQFFEAYLLWERNFPVECPDPSHPGTGHLEGQAFGCCGWGCWDCRWLGTVISFLHSDDNNMTTRMYHFKYRVLIRLKPSLTSDRHNYQGLLGKIT